MLVVVAEQRWVAFKLSEVRIGGSNLKKKYDGRIANACEYIYIYNIQK